MIRSHEVSKSSKGFTSNFAPRRDRPYRVGVELSPTTFQIHDPGDDRIIGKFHTTELTPFVGDVVPPVLPRRKRGRPKKSAEPVRRTIPGSEGENVARGNGSGEGTGE